MDMLQIKNQAELDLFLSVLKTNHIQNVRFNQLTLDSVGFQNMTLTNVQFVDCTLLDVNFSAGTLIDCAFISCTFEIGYFWRATFVACCFEKCSMRQSNFSGSNLRNTRIHSCNVHGSSFSSTTLKEVSWKWTDRSACDFNYSAFELCDANTFYTTDMGFITQIFAHIATLAVVDETDEFKEVMDYIRKQFQGAKYTERKYLRYEEEELSEIVASCHRITSKNKAQEATSTEPIPHLDIAENNVNPYNEVASYHRAFIKSILSPYNEAETREITKCFSECVKKRIAAHEEAIRVYKQVFKEVKEIEKQGVKNA